MSLAWYRKYRPQSLEELIGQQKVKKILKAAFEQERLSHAYLFSGPRGTGKTSTARILGKMVNCQAQDKTKIPCNQCSSCVAIMEGSSLDLIEIDAASNRGIDEIRSLRENIKLAPSSAAKKIYIIDEVHMLTAEAFNALLKTLEEPPSHVLFILATTDPQKIPSTILSRVQKLEFQQPTITELVEALEKVAAAEKLKVAPEALELIAQRADGSFRDGLKLLEQLSAIDREITVQLVEDFLQGNEFEKLMVLTDYLAQKNARGALELLSQMHLQGFQPKEFLLNLIDLYRALLFIKQGLKTLVDEKFGSVRAKQIQDIEHKFSVETIIESLEILQQAFERIKTAPIALLPLELAVSKLCLEQQVSSIPETSSKPLQIIANSDNPKSQPIISENGQRQNEVVSSETSNQPELGQVAIIKDKWNYILETIKPYNYSLEALLRNAEIVDCEQGKVVIGVPYSFHQRILEAPKNRNILESILSDVLNQAVSIRVTLIKRELKVEELANVEVAQDDEILRLAAEIFNSEN